MIVDSHRAARARPPPKSPPSSPSAGSAATAPISSTGATSSAATVRRGLRARAIWRGAGRRRWRLPRKRGSRRISRPPDARLCLPGPRRAQPRQWQFCARQRSRRAVEQSSSLARTPYIAIGEMNGTAASGRILLAAPIAAGRHRASFRRAYRGRRRDNFDRGAMALRARRKRTLHAITLSEATLAVSPRRRRAHLRGRADRRGSRRLPWSKAAKTMARPRDVFAQGRGRELA